MQVKCFYNLDLNASLEQHTPHVVSNLMEDAIYWGSIMLSFLKVSGFQKGIDKTLIFHDYVFYFFSRWNRVHNGSRPIYLKIDWSK